MRIAIVILSVDKSFKSFGNAGSYLAYFSFLILYTMKNIYNKGTFRSYEWGKIGSYLKKQGNKKWRRTEKSEIENELNETIKFFKQRKKKRKLIWAKITREINGRTDSDYKGFYSEKSFKSSISRAHVTRYFLMDRKKRKK